MAVEIKSKPTTAPGSVAVSRSKNTYAVSWKVGSGATSTNSDHRATGVVAELRIFGQKKDKTGKWVNFTNPTIRKATYGTGAKKMTTLYKDSKGATQNYFDRSLYPPYSMNRRVSYMMGYARYTNSKGLGPVSKKQYDFVAPTRPTIGTPTTSGNEVSFPLSVPAAAGRAERACVEYSLYLTRNYDNQGNTVKAERKLVKESKLSYDKASGKWSGLWLGSVAKESTNVNYSNGYLNAMTLESHYAEFELEAKSRGIAGDSAVSTKKLTIRYAEKPIVEENGKPTYVCAVDKNGSINIVTLFFKFTKGSAVKSVRLEKKYSESRPGSDGWQKVEGAVGDKNCRALGTSAANLVPEIGDNVWLRVVAEYITDNREQPSDPVCIEELYRAYATQEALASQIAVGSLTSNTPDTLTAQIGWANDDLNGTEISWSKDGDAWRSTKAPDSFQMPDNTWREDGITVVVDDTVEPPETITYANSTTVKIMGLDEASLYYVRARRYDTEDDRNATGWTKAKAAITGVSAVGLLASAPSLVAYGRPIPVSWSSGGGSGQTEWRIVLDGVAVASGIGADQASEIAAELIPDFEEATKSFVLSVISTTGSGETESNPVAVTVAKAPVATVSREAATITEKPVSYTVGCDQAATVRTWVEAAGVSNELPDGNEEQYAGDIIWSGTFAVEPGSPVTVEVPESARLIDGAAYSIRATPWNDYVTGETVSAVWTAEELDADGNVVSTYETDQTDVVWAHQAKAPESCTVTVSDKAVEVYPATPVGAAESDVFDLYRITPDGAYQIANSISFGNAVTDRYAPYSDYAPLSYRVATRTTDGDVDWADFSYELSDNVLRFDWDGKSVELPYNVKTKDKFKKGFEARTYLDGSTEGWWSDGIERRASIDTALIKIFDQEKLKLIRELARYTGPVFVRTPDGTAFEANVTVDDVAGLASSLIGEASFEATELECETYICGVEDVRSVL